MPLELSWAEAYHGCEKVVTYRPKVGCDVCKGSGAALGTQATPCASCSGAGFVTTGQGLFAVRQTCAPCSGYGTTLAEPCAACGGAGVVARERTLRVRIPAGVDEWQQVRLKDKGDQGARLSGQHGTLFLTLTVQPHPRFRREDLNVHVDLPLSLPQALLGDEVRLPLPAGGEVPLRVPPGVQPNERLTLPRQGMRRDKEHGSLHVHFRVHLPRRLSPAQEEAVRALASASGDSLAPPPPSSGLLTRLRRLLPW